MSYSRWSHSRWYTIWHCASGEDPSNQVFAVYDANGPTFFFRAYDIKDVTKEGLRQWFEGPDNELDELHGYITEWLGDVNDAFGGSQ